MTPGRMVGGLELLWFEFFRLRVDCCPTASGVQSCSSLHQPVVDVLPLQSHRPLGAFKGFHTLFKGCKISTRSLFFTFATAKPITHMCLYSLEYTQEPPRRPNCRLYFRGFQDESRRIPTRRKLGVGGWGRSGDPERHAEVDSIRRVPRAAELLPDGS